MKKLKIIFFFSLFYVCFSLLALSFASQPLIDHKVAKIGALDKITGRVKEFDIKVGEMGQFYKLDIYIKSCQANPPNKSPENSAYLEIYERIGKDRLRKKLFQGWMYASSPAVSAMDHAVYDVWVVKCHSAMR